MMEFLGVDIFSYDGWDDLDGDFYAFYNIEFCFEHMKKFNGFIANVNRSGRMDIVERGTKDKAEVRWSGFITDIPDFLTKLKHKKVVN